MLRSKWTNLTAWRTDRRRIRNAQIWKTWQVVPRAHGRVAGNTHRGVCQNTLSQATALRHLESSWFGRGAQTKMRAWDTAVRMTA